MWLSYIIALVPLVVGGVLWLKFKTVHWVEWAGGAAVGLLVSFLFNVAAVSSMTADTETWSGYILKSRHSPEWVEKYKEDVYKTVTGSDGKSKRVFSHTVTKYRTHPEHWDCYTTTNDSYSISREFHNEIVSKFGKQTTVMGNKSGFHSGDPNYYDSQNITGYMFPTTVQRSFENRVKAAPSLFSYASVPSTTPVFEYPKNRNWMSSDRVLGTARGKITTFEWDKMNARIGATKKVNVIIVGFEGQDSEIAHKQEAKWIGGKKNDLVICYGDNWSYVFGWTERHLCKRNLETIVNENEATDALIPLIEREIVINYQIKDWTKFDYIAIDIPAKWYFWLVFIMLVTQIGLWYWMGGDNGIDADTDVFAGLKHWWDGLWNKNRGYNHHRW